MTPLRPRKGRGAPTNPIGRFETLDIEYEPSDDELPILNTELFKDAAKSVISFNDSPDLGFDASFNPYRGCEHGCAYCYARPTHEYLGLSADLDFESKMFVKENAPKLLKKALAQAQQPKRLVAWPRLGRKLHEVPDLCRLRRSAAGCRQRRP